MYKLIIIFFLAFIFTSCEKEIKFKQKDVEPKIVINALLNTDSAWVINVSHSLNILDKNKPKELPDANVVLKDMEGNILEVLNHSADGNFISANNSKPIFGKSYQLEVTHKNYKTIEANTVIPTPVFFEIIDTTKVVFKSEESMRVRIRFTDPAAEANYYFIKAMVEYKSYLFDEFGNIVDSMYNNYPEQIGSSNLNFENLDENNSKSSELYLKDNLINGKTVEIDLYMNYFLFQLNEFSNISLVLASAGKDFYLHKISKNKHDNIQDNPFAEPVIIYSNIKNGIGIFAGYSYTALPLK